MRNKAQSAMEYLMTYGWAILIVIVVVAALYAMGVFSSKGGVPCSPCFNTFAYRDHNSTVLYIRNGARELSSLTVTAGGLTCTPAADIVSGADITCTGTITDGLDVTLSYVVKDSTITKEDTAKLHTV